MFGAIFLFLVLTVNAEEGRVVYTTPTTTTTNGSVNPDGNASSICSGDEVLLGNGSCSDTTPYLASGSGDNSTWNEEYANNLYLPHTVDTDTNRSDADILGVCTIYNDTAWVLAQNYLTSYTETDPHALSAIAGNNTAWSLDTDTNRSDAEILSVAAVYNETTWVLNQGYITEAGAGDGNASSICSGGEVLLGNSTCWDSVNFFDDTTIPNTNDGNASSICSGDEVLLGNGSCSTSSAFGGVGAESDPHALAAIAGNNTAWSLDTDTNRTDADILGVCTVYNETQWVLDQSYLTSYTETDPHALGAISGNNTAWLSTFNATYDAFTDTDTNLTESHVEAFIFDDDNNANFNMTHNNVTDVDCIFFKSGGKICSGE